MRSNPVMYEHVYCQSMYPTTTFTISEQPATWFAFCKNSDGYLHIGYWNTEQNINTYVRTGNNSWHTGTISFNDKTVTLSTALTSQSSDIYVMYDY